MGLMHSLKQRRREPEIQDQLDLDDRSLIGALRGLERVNSISRISSMLWKPLQALARDHPSRPLRILDIATGAGDLPIQLWRRARKAGLTLDIAGCDMNPRTVAYAQQRAEEQQANVQFFPLNVSDQPIPGDYDVVMCSLFLHHLDDDQAVRLLRDMARACTRMALVNDLIRCTAGWVLAYLGARGLLTSRVNHVDAPRSVAAAFTIDEIKQMVQHAGLDGGARIERIWPCRFLLTLDSI